jgi:uncharacterized membrane protein YjgN (DUF898 family)
LGVAQAVAVSAAPRPELRLEFHGVGREYFRIWIVNLALTLLTLGVFSAWAKVRKKRYLYSHTVLDGTPFQYLAQPVPILKGRIIAAIAFVTYYAATHFFPIALPFVFAVALPVAPWVIVRSAAFNARYSAFRNMTLSFDGTYRDAAVLVFWWGIIPAMVIGQSYAWWGHPTVGAVVFACFGLTFPAWQREQTSFLVSHTRYGGAKGRFSASTGQFFKIYLAAGAMFVVAAAFGVFLMGVAVSSKAPKPVGLIVFLVVIYSFWILVGAYVRARVSNLVWNQTRLGPLRFDSKLEAGELGYLYLTNVVAILASLGLLIPWAVLRTQRYRAACLHVRVEGDLEEFRGSNETTVRAAGAELGDFFDLDFSL